MEERDRPLDLPFLRQVQEKLILNTAFHKYFKMTYIDVPSNCLSTNYQMVIHIYHLVLETIYGQLNVGKHTSAEFMSLAEHYLSDSCRKQMKEIKQAVYSQYPQLSGILDQMFEDLDQLSQSLQSGVQKNLH